MKTRHFLFGGLGVAALAVAFVVAWWRPPATTPEPDEPEEPWHDPSALPMSRPGCNVVFVSFDALQAKHVGHLGHTRNTTPTLDAMAKRAFVFEKAYAASSWTVPSSMTWFTGVSPSEHRLTNKFAFWRPDASKTADLRDLSPALVTLADVFRQNGYATAGFTGNAGVSGMFGYDQGFDLYDHPKGAFGSFSRSVPEALKWLRVNGRRRFFLFLHGYDCHGQYVPPGGYDRRFVSKDYDRRFTGSESEQERLREEGLERGTVAVRPVDVEFWRSIYDEKIARADAMFKVFLQEFAAVAPVEETLFVVTSDHGTEMHEHGRFDHGFTLYEELVRVPLLIRLPGQMHGKRVGANVGSVDLMPTILELAGLGTTKHVRRQMRGRSLTDHMRGAGEGREVFVETDYREYTYKRAMVDADGWKYILTLETNAGELYHLGDDPGERMNRAEGERERAAAMRRRLEEHYRGLGHDLSKREWKRGMNPVYSSQGK